MRAKPRYVMTPFRRVKRRSPRHRYAVFRWPVSASTFLHDLQFLHGDEALQMALNLPVVKVR